MLLHCNLHIKLVFWILGNWWRKSRALRPTDEARRVLTSEVTKRPKATLKELQSSKSPFQAQNTFRVYRKACCMVVAASCCGNVYLNGRLSLRNDAHKNLGIFWLSGEIDGKCKKFPLQWWCIMKVWHLSRSKHWWFPHLKQVIETKANNSGGYNTTMGFRSGESAGHSIWGSQESSSRSPMMRLRWAGALSSMKMKLGLCCPCRGTITGLMMLFR